MRQGIWTLSNALSFVRLLLAIPISLLLIRNEPASNVYAALLMVTAAVTDLFDGMLARMLNEVTEFGKIIDPLADKISVGIITIILAVQNKLPVWFLASVLVRDAIIFLGGVYIRRAKGIILQSNWTGKWAVTTVALFVLVVVLDLESVLWLKEVLLMASTIMLVISFVLYLKRFLQIAFPQSSVVKNATSFSKSEIPK